MPLRQLTASLYKRFIRAAPRVAFPQRPEFSLRQLSILGLRPSLRAFSSSPFRLENAPSPQNSSDAASSSTTSASPAPQNRITLETPEPRLSLTFTCTVEGCRTRSTHQFTKRSYEKGIVLVECPGCKNRHLIADNLGWFKESTEDGTLKTVEDLLRAKGEKVRRGRLDAGGAIEYAPE